MPFQLRRADREDSRGTNRANRGDARKFHPNGVIILLLCKTEADLTAAGQFDVKLCQQFSVEQCAMLDAMAAIDAVPGAKRVQAMLGARMQLARDRDRVDHPRHRHFGQAAKLQLMVEEAEIEPCIMRDQMAVLQKVEQLRDPRRKERLVL
jgi:hypothetical protein